MAITSAPDIDLTCKECMPKSVQSPLNQSLTNCGNLSIEVWWEFESSGTIHLLHVIQQDQVLDCSSNWEVRCRNCQGHFPMQLINSHTWRLVMFSSKKMCTFHELCRLTVSSS